MNRTLSKLHTKYDNKKQQQQKKKLQIELEFSLREKQKKISFFMLLKIYLIILYIQCFQSIFLHCHCCSINATKKCINKRTQKISNSVIDWFKMETIFSNFYCIIDIVFLFFFFTSTNKYTDSYCVE